MATGSPPTNDITPGYPRNRTVPSGALRLASTRVLGRVALPIVTPIEDGVVVTYNRLDPIAVRDST